MNEELYIGFENYLINEMLPEERFEFEQKLQSDNEFKEKFQLYKETTGFIEARFSKESDSFKENLKAVSSEYFKEKAKAKSRIIAFRPWQYAVAASLVILLGTWFFLQNINPTYGDYNQHESAYFTERGTDNVNLKNAQDFFNAQDYKNTVLAFEKVENIKEPELQYFFAIALIETNDFSKSTLLLNTIKEGNSVYKDKATWYLALSNLKQNKISDCILFLKQIPQESEDFEKAQQLLNDLN